MPQRARDPTPPTRWSREPGPRLRGAESQTSASCSATSSGCPLGPASSTSPLAGFAFHHFAHPHPVLAEMTRVLKPGARMVIVDQTTSEDPAKSEYHNRLERLCDPSHARAIAASEWERMIAETGLEVSYRGGLEISFDLETWMSHGGPPPERRAQIIEMMEAAVATDRSGLKVRRENGQIWFSHTGVTYALTKPLR